MCHTYFMNFSWMWKLNIIECIFLLFSNICVEMNWESTRQFVQFFPSSPSYDAQAASWQALRQVIGLKF